MLIDHERVLLGLKAHIATKRSHGQDELLRKLAELEVESRIPEGQELFDERPFPARSASVADRRPRGQTHNEQVEDTHTASVA